MRTNLIKMKETLEAGGAGERDKGILSNGHFQDRVFK